MKRLATRLFYLVLAALPCAATGCLGGTQNPSYFPYLWPFGDIIPTHAKPPGRGYYANFDPYSVRLEVRPLGPENATNQVRTQHVLIATIYDDKGNPRRDRRVEWILEGVGSIIEVDEHGHLPGRGYKEGTKYAVSYTARDEHRISRGNTNKSDDIMIRPGQTWCVFSSGVEGDSHVTVYAPGIQDWEKGRVFVTARWVDAGWEFPPPASARTGAEHVFTTRIFRATDRQPLANYRVRYRILDGPAAVLLPSRTGEYTAVSDLSGNAQVAIVQAAPAFGRNRVSVEIIRPPDPTAPSGSGIVIAKGETFIDWLAPNVTLNLNGPATAVVNQEAVYDLAIVNSGRIESRSQTVTMPIPDGMEYVRSNPPAFRDGPRLVWTKGPLAAEQAHKLQTVFKATRPGDVVVSAAVETEEGQKDQKAVRTQVVTAALKVDITGPATAAVGVAINYTITVRNPGGGPLDNVVLTAQLDDGLEHVSKAKTLNLNIGALAAQQSKNETLTVTPRKMGQLACKVFATSGALSDQAQHLVNVQQAAMSLSITGPKVKYKGTTDDFVIRVGNPSEVALANVVVRDRLPAELEFVSAGQGGQQVAGEVVWNLGALGPREEKSLVLTARAKEITKKALQAVTASADGGLSKDVQAALEIFGKPGLGLRVSDAGSDPAEVGKKVIYTIKVENSGTLPANDVEIKAFIPAEMKLSDAKGPTQVAVADKVLTFGKVTVEPGTERNFIIEMDTLRAGDVRFRVEMRGANLIEPVFEEESTNIFDPRAPGPPATPAPPG